MSPEESFTIKTFLFIMNFHDINFNCQVCVNFKHVSFVSISNKYIYVDFGKFRTIIFAVNLTENFGKSSCV